MHFTETFHVVLLTGPDTVLSMTHDGPMGTTAPGYPGLAALSESLGLAVHQYQRAHNIQKQMLFRKWVRETPGNILQKYSKLCTHRLQNKISMGTVFSNRSAIRS